MLYGGAAVLSAVLCLYLLLSRGNAIAPGTTPPARLRRWAGAFFGVAALGHLWWYLFIVLSGDTGSWAYVACVVLDCVLLLTTIFGTMLDIKPIITEESMMGTAFKKYTFKVAKDANKAEIKNAVEEAFGVSVSWDAESQTVFVSGEINPILPGWAYYDETSVYWLSHIIYSEAGGESLDGQIAVGQVVLNRVGNACWPNNIHDVLFDDRCGVQFSPTANGTIYMEPSGMAVAAAKMALEGADIVGDSYYFLNPDVSSDRWFERNCEYVTTIGSHRFYTGGLW